MAVLIRSFIGAAILVVVSGCSGNGPEQLAHKLENALKSADIDAEMALLDARGVSAQAQFFYRDLVNDCLSMSCVVSVGPLSSEFKERAAKQLQTESLEFVVAPEGVLKVTGESANKQEHMAMEMPYAKVDGQYKIIANIYTPAKVAELSAKTAQAVADELLANGVGDPPDKEWKNKAHALAVGGGEAGAMLVARNNAMVAAARANDPQAMVTALGQVGQIIYGDKDYKGTPIPLKNRQLKLRAQSVRFDYDMKVVGGYALDDVYALIYEARDGAGWTVRGCNLGTLKNGQWQAIASNEIAIPPG